NVEMVLLLLKMATFSTGVPSDKLKTFTCCGKIDGVTKLKLTRKKYFMLFINPDSKKTEIKNKNRSKKQEYTDIAH
ncbi:MAG: hypothetical protein ACOCXD_00225, partial [Bacteroidota bacterium]